MTTEEHVSHYMINKGLQFANLTDDERFILDFNRLLYLLLIIESEYMKLTNISLFNEDFFVTEQGLAIGATNESVYDIYFTDYLKQKLSIFENVISNKYECKAFEFIPQELICEIADNVMLVFGMVSLDELRELIKNKLNVKFDYTTIISKEELMQISFFNGKLDIKNKPRKRIVSISE